MSKIWRCPECETINQGDKCIVCGYENPDFEEQSSNGQQLPNEQQQVIGSQQKKGYVQNSLKNQNENEGNNVVPEQKAKLFGKVIVAVSAIAAVFAVIILVNIGMPKNTAPEIPILSEVSSDDVSDSTYESAFNSSVISVGEELSDEAAEIVTSVPETETAVVTGTAEETLLMPNLVGMTVAEAVSACSSMGIKYTIQMIENPYAEPGYVMGQSVAADSAVDDDTAVIIIVCEQSRTTTVAETTTESSAAVPITTTKTAVPTTTPVTTTTITTTTMPDEFTEEATDPWWGIYVESSEDPFRAEDDTEPWWETFTDSLESSVSEAKLITIESGKCGDNVEYSLDNNGLLFIYGSGDMYDYKLSSYGSGIADYFGEDSPFGGKNKIKEVVIDNGVTSIGAGIFAGCGCLESVDIPETLLRIGKDSFSCSGIKEIYIPQNVEIVGEGVFEDCEKLKKADISAQIIDRYAFAYCENLEEVVLEESVKEFGRMSFNGHWNDNKSLKKIVIKNRDCGMSTYRDGYIDTGECIPTQTTIYGYRGSTAEEYAKNYGKKFVALDE